MPVVTPIKEGTARRHCSYRRMPERLTTIGRQPGAWSPNQFQISDDKTGLFLRAKMQRIGEYFMFGRLRAMLAGLAVWAMLHASINPSLRKMVQATPKTIPRALRRPEAIVTPIRRTSRHAGFSPPQG